MVTSQEIIEQTKKWINDVVVGCNFCPFAASAVKQQTIHYQVETGATLNVCLEAVLQEAIRLNNETNIETTLLIFPNAFQLFNDYLDLVSLSEKLLKQKRYEGIYQLASFHP